MSQDNYHQTSYVIYYEDTDLSGHVYHANYVKYFDRGRTEALKSKGLHVEHLHADGIQFIVSELQLKYFKPASLNERIIVRTKILKVAGARIYFEQEVRNSAHPSSLLCSGQVIIGCVDKDFKPRRISKDLKKELM